MIQTNPSIPVRRQNLAFIYKKKRNCHLMDFTILADCKVKIKGKKLDKYLNLARELKKLWNMMVIPIVVEAFGTVPKNLEKGQGELEIRGRIETSQTPTLLKSARIFWRVLETREDLVSFRLQRKKNHQLELVCKTLLIINNHISSVKFSFQI